MFIQVKIALFANQKNIGKIKIVEIMVCLLRFKMAELIQIKNNYHWWVDKEK